MTFFYTKGPPLFPPAHSSAHSQRRRVDGNRPARSAPGARSPHRPSAPPHAAQTRRRPRAIARPHRPHRADRPGRTNRPSRPATRRRRYAPGPAGQRTARGFGPVRAGLAGLPALADRRGQHACRLTSPSQADWLQRGTSLCSLLTPVLALFDASQATGLIFRMFVPQDHLEQG